MVKYTIAIPAYKSQFLREAIRSVLHQTFHDFELVIVNDCSPEDLDSLIGEFSDQRIKYYKNVVNCGALNVVDNWNICLSKSSGDYILLLGDDDILSPHCLELIESVATNYKTAPVIHLRSAIIDSNGNMISVNEAWGEHEDFFDNLYQRLKFFRKQYIGDFVYRREELLRIGGYVKLPYAWGSDDLTLYQITEGRYVKNINEVLFYYRRNVHSITSSSSVDGKLASLDIYRKKVEGFIMNSDKNDKLLLSSRIWLNTAEMFFKKRRIGVLANSLSSGFFKNASSNLVRVVKQEVTFYEYVNSFLEWMLRRKRK